MGHGSVACFFPRTTKWSVRFMTSIIIWISSRNRIFIRSCSGRSCFFYTQFHTMCGGKATCYIKLALDSFTQSSESSGHVENTALTVSICVIGWKYCAGRYDLWTSVKHLFNLKWLSWTFASIWRFNPFFCWIIWIYFSSFEIEASNDER